MRSFKLTEGLRVMRSPKGYFKRLKGRKRRKGWTYGTIISKKFVQDVRPPKKRLLPPDDYPLFEQMQPEPEAQQQSLLSSEERELRAAEERIRKEQKEQQEQQQIPELAVVDFRQALMQIDMVLTALTMLRSSLLCATKVTYQKKETE